MAREYFSFEDSHGFVFSTKHGTFRAESREDLNDDFIVGRFMSLVENETFRDLVINEMPIGKSFVIKDNPMGYMAIVAHDVEDDNDIFNIVTLRSSLRVGNGQHVLHVGKNGVKNSIWNNMKHSFEAV